MIGVSRKDSMTEFRLSLVLDISFLGKEQLVDIGADVILFRLKSTGYPDDT